MEISSSINQDITERCIKKQDFVAVFCINYKPVWCEIPFWNTFVRTWDSKGHCPVRYIEDFAREGKKIVYYNLSLKKLKSLRKKQKQEISLP